MIASHSFRRFSDRGLYSSHRVTCTIHYNWQCRYVAHFSEAALLRMCSLDISESRYKTWFYLWSMGFFLTGYNFHSIFYWLMKYPLKLSWVVYRTGRLFKKTLKLLLGDWELCILCRIEDRPSFHYQSGLRLILQTTDMGWPMQRWRNQLL